MNFLWSSYEVHNKFLRRSHEFHVKLCIYGFIWTSYEWASRSIVISPTTTQARLNTGLSRRKAPAHGSSSYQATCQSSIRPLRHGVPVVRLTVWPPFVLTQEVPTGLQLAWQDQRSHSPFALAERNPELTKEHDSSLLTKIGQTLENSRSINTKSMMA